MKLTNKLNLPQPFVDAATREYEYKDKRYSVTSILKGVKEIMLVRRHNNEITADVSDMIWLIFGTAVHKILEEAQEAKDELKETKVAIELPNGYTLSGQQDLYTESLKRITDYKTGSVEKILFNEWDDYRKQCLVYAWMFRKLGFEVDNAEIVMILKNQSQTKANYDMQYPQHPVHIQHFDFGEDDFKYIEQWIMDKFKEIEKYESVEDDLLPTCTPEERWEKPTKYAVMKKGNKKALKLHETEEAANAHADQMGTGYFVEKRPGVDKKCTEYCSAAPFCSYYQQIYGGKHDN